MNPIPWYQSAVLRGLLITLFTQLIARIASQYHIDISALASAGIDADHLTQMALDAISAIAIAYAAHGRVAKPNPPITLTKPTGEPHEEASTADPPPKS